MKINPLSAVYLVRYEYLRREMGNRLPQPEANMACLLHHGIKIQKILKRKISPKTRKELFGPKIKKQKREPAGIQNFEKLNFT